MKVQCRLIMSPNHKPGGKAFQIAIAKDAARSLDELATAAGMSPGEFLRAGLEKWLYLPRPDFPEAAFHILDKNAELYRCLA